MHQRTERSPTELAQSYRATRDGPGDHCAQVKRAQVMMNQLRL